MTAVYLTIGLLAVAAIGFLAFLLLIKPRSRKNAPDLTPFIGKEYAHRGLHGKNVPENSLRAFELAAERGLGIELDIQLSKDGEVMVVHDFDLRRVAGRPEKVRDLTAKELSEVSLLGTGDGIPTLEQVLEVVDGRVPLIVEIKIPGFDLSVCPKAFEILDRYRGAYCVESFHPLAIRWVRKHRPNVVRGQLSSNFFGHAETGSAVQFFAVRNLLLNVLARPDFIAFDIRYPNDLAFRLCCKVWGALPIGWTIRTHAELEEAKKTFAAWICEDIYDEGT